MLLLGRQLGKPLRSLVQRNRLREVGGRRRRALGRDDGGAAREDVELVLLLVARTLDVPQRAVIQRRIVLGVCERAVRLFPQAEDDGLHDRVGEATSDDGRPTDKRRTTSRRTSERGKEKGEGERQTGEAAGQHAINNGYARRRGKCLGAERELTKAFAARRLSFDACTKSSYA